MPDARLTDADRQHRRVLWAARLTVIAMTVLMTVFIGRVLYLQARPPRRLEPFISGRASSSPIQARRGALLDARGRPLAISRLGYRLFADPALIEAPGEFAVHVAHAIDDDPARIDRLLDERFSSRYIVLRPLLDERELAAVRHLRLPGLATQPRHVRHYPHGALAAQVIGFVGADQRGLEGVEYALEPVLSGDPGALRTLRDARRRPLWVERSGYVPPEDGHDVRLSIDLVVQQIAEEELAAACEQYRAKRAELVVMEARTGQLLAMANWPPFDANRPLAAATAVRRNHCVTDAYEPGSVFKPFIHARASAAGLARPQQIIDCTTDGLWVTPKGRRLHDAHPHGSITWEQVLIVSSNIGMAKVASEMGERGMYEAVRSFGFGQRTGTALPGESPGIVNPLPQWTHYSVTSVPMGQEIAVTPVQMVRAFSAFANGGLMVRPTVLAAEADAPQYERAVGRAAADATRLLLRRVVTEGTGRRAESELYRVWGKTGTAQVPDRVHGGYKQRAYTGSFICGAPLRDPKIIVLVTVHEPDASIAYYGGVISAPVAKRVVDRVLPYLGVAPDMPQADDPSYLVASAP